MQTEKDPHTLAHRYFEGHIAPEEEKELFAYIRQTDGHFSQFKKWEKTWKQTQIPSEKTRQEWQRLQTRMQRQTAMHLIGAAPRLGLWKKAAVIALLIASAATLSIGLKHILSDKPQETYFTSEAPYGEKSRVALPDGTTIWLNAGSRLTYSSRYNAPHRNVTLDGEGYFEVVKQAGAPFTVRTAAYAIVVKGTKFNVSAYAEDTYIATTLLEGAVVLDYKGKEIPLHPGESMRLDLPSGRFKRTKINARQSKAWAENRIEFDHIPLQELLAKLSRQYNVPIHLERKEAGEKTLCISLRNRETIGEVMTALQQIIPLQIERKGKDIYIR